MFYLVGVVLWLFVIGHLQWITTKAFRIRNACLFTVCDGDAPMRRPNITDREAYVLVASVDARTERGFVWMLYLVLAMLLTGFLFYHVFTAQNLDTGYLFLSSGVFSAYVITFVVTCVAQYLIRKNVQLQTIYVPYWRDFD